ncbi:MAG TPA: lysylphosphatidylglycerol synthase transmembrane domain-containing protein [Chitinispirillaceae bacterium]|nr:lysylphosphatidylglycerol synthase transmembrane domain-containing protein [Chitinispirillaceae bacterium]
MKYLSIVVRVAVIFICFSCLYMMRTDILNGLKTTIHYLALWWLIPILFLSFTNLITEPSRWYLLFSVTGNHQSIKKLYHIFMVIALGSCTLPFRMGLPLRLFLIHSKLGVSFATTTSFLLIDTILSYGMWLFFALIGILFLFWGFGPASAIPIVSIAFLTVAGIIFILQKQHVMPEFMAKRFGELQTQLAIIKFIPWISRTSMIMIFDIFVYSFRHFLILTALDIHLSFFSVIMMVAIGFCGGLLSMMPMGLGGYDLSTVFMLMHLGVPRECAILVPVIERFVMLSSSVIFGSISLHELHISWKSFKTLPAFFGKKVFI